MDDELLEILHAKISNLELEVRMARHAALTEVLELVKGHLVTQQYGRCDCPICTTVHAIYDDIEARRDKEP